MRPTRPASRPRHHRPRQDQPAIRNDYDDDGRLIAHRRRRQRHRLQPQPRCPPGGRDRPQRRPHGLRVQRPRPRDRGDGPQGRTTRYEYDAQGHQTAVIDALSRRTEYEYDDKGRPSSWCATRSGTRRARPTIARQRDPQRSALGRVTRNEYDAAGRLLTTFNPLDETTRRTPTTPTGRSRRVTTAATRRATTTTCAGGSRGHCTRTDPSALRLRRGRQPRLGERGPELPNSALWTTTRPQVATEYIYDTNGRVTETRLAEATTDEHPIVTTTAYTALGQVEPTTDGAAHPDPQPLRPPGPPHRGAVGGQLPRPRDDLESPTATTRTASASGTETTNRVSPFRYDGAGRLIRTTYHDGS